MKSKEVQNYRKFSHRFFILLALPSLLLTIELKAQGVADSCQQSSSMQAVTTATESFPPLAASLSKLSCSLFKDESPFHHPPLEDHIFLGHKSHFGKLTPFWAQSEIGADLVQADMEKMRLADALGPKAKIAIIDGEFDTKTLAPSQYTADFTLLEPTLPEKKKASGFLRPLKASVKDFFVQIYLGDHGTRVANLILGTPPVGVGYHLQLRRFYQGGMTANLQELHDELTSPAAKKLVLDIINMSMSLPDSLYEKNKSKIDDVLARTIFVTSSGNNYPEEMQKFNQLEQVIAVGSATPNGFSSRFSQEGPGLDILAPSDYHILSNMGPYKDQKLRRLPGTSFAAPLVSGAIANVVSVLPGITTPAIKILLQKTGLQSAALEKFARPEQGNVLLNAYRLWKVALRLSERGWPMDKEKALLELNDDSLYDFKEEAQELLLAATKQLQRPSCSELKEAVQSLRQSFFLDPRNLLTRHYLGQLYQLHGYISEAQFYGTNTYEEILKSVEDKETQFLLRLRQEGASPKILALVQDHLESAAVPDLWIEFSAEFLGKDILKVLQKVPDSIYMKSITPLLRGSFRIPDFQARIQVLKWFARQGKKERKELSKLVTYLQRDQDRKIVRKELEKYK